MTEAHELPKLAFVYHPRATPALSVVAAARGLCALVWVLDSSDPDLGSNARLLARFGPVVDVSGQSVDEAAVAIAAQGVDGIVALADSRLGWTAQVADRLALPFHSPAVATVLTDKFEQRAALRAGGLATPGSWLIAGADDRAALDRIRSETTFPAVLKPRQGETSRYTTRVGGIDELTTALADFAGHGDGTRDFVLEEYIADADGPVAGAGFANYLSVESVVSQGAISHVALTGRMPQAHPFRETGFCIPSALPAAQTDAVLAIASRAAAALGVTIGCLHTEIKLTPAGPVVIEVNGRIGGGIAEMLQAASGIDLLPIALRLALGARIAYEQPWPCRGVGYTLLTHAPLRYRRLLGIEGLDQLRAEPGVEELIVNRGPGQSVDWREGTNGFVYLATGVVDDWAGVHRIRRAMDSLVTINGE